ncbi:MAG: hypothetical protein J7K96_13265 [Desulfobacteraceae bacterium]|nr:hypothetical protein [Desulfobacteraceae bacterium]
MPHIIKSLNKQVTKNGKIFPSVGGNFIVKQEFFPAWQEFITGFQRGEAIQEPGLSA